MLRRPLIAIALLHAGGCVLLLTDELSEVGSHCTFGASDSATTCQDCIATQCQTQVDGCCDPAAGCHVLDALDNCAQGYGCEGFASSSGLGGADASLQQCISQSCTTQCFGSSSTSTSTGSSMPSGPCSTISRDECLCLAGSPGDGTPCTEDTIASSVCCADENYPADGTFCTCERMRCQTINSQSGTYCTCTLGGTASDGIDDSCGSGWLHCCIGFLGCTCTDDTPCDGDSEVFSCDANADVCTDRRVTSCDP